MKKLLPARLKQLLWFIFKAPQRKFVGFDTLATEVKAYVSLAAKSNKLKPVSICTGLKNRSQNYLDYVLKSISVAEHSELIELCVFDCGSDDMPDLVVEIRKIWKGSLIFQSVPGVFSRSHTFNKAVELSTNDIIFICDADISLPADIVKRINKNVTDKAAWFPIINSIEKDGTEKPFRSGAGIFASLKESFVKAGLYDESFKTWGHEDWLLYFEFYKNDIAALRTFEPGIKHHWHPSLKPEDFKPLF
ncbi:MAG: hypothetical protein H7321_03940 [Bacteroidia bacterium]|nr:hypothetical protein [Bacteroidia bacterium]